MIARSKTLAIAAAVIFVHACGAAAQPQTSNPLFATPQIITTYSVNEMIALLEEAGLTARFATEWPAGEYDKVVETTIEDVTVYFNLRGCEAEGADAPCKIVQPTMYFEGSGATLAKLNAFHLDRSSVSVAGLGENGDVTFWSKIWLVDGVTLDNLKFMIGMFLNDAEALSRSLFETTAVAGAEARGLGAAGPHMARAKAEYPWRRNAANAAQVGLLPARAKAVLFGEIDAPNADDVIDD